MSLGLGRLTHMSDSLRCLGSGQRWDMVFFDTQGSVQRPSMLAQHQNLFVALVGLTWGLHLRRWDRAWFLPMVIQPGEAKCKFSQMLKESGLMKNSNQALGAIGLRSVRWRYHDTFMTYAPLRMEEKSTITCDHTTCAWNDHQIGRAHVWTPVTG